MTTQHHEALRLAAELDDGYPLTGDAISAAAELRRQHARITDLESQLAQRFDAADVATAAAQGFRDGVASVSAGSEPVAVVGSDFTLYLAGTGPIAPIVEKHGIKVGSPLYTHPYPPDGTAWWISVDERLPGEQGHDSEQVLVFINGHCKLTDMECRQGGAWGLRLGYFDADRQAFRVHGRPEPHVTHWRQEPPAPPLPAATGPADGDGDGNELW